MMRKVSKIPTPPKIRKKVRKIERKTKRKKERKKKYLTMKKLPGFPLLVKRQKTERPKEKMTEKQKTERQKEK